MYNSGILVKRRRAQAIYICIQGQGRTKIFCHLDKNSEVKLIPNSHLPTLTEPSSSLHPNLIQSSNLACNWRIITLRTKATKCGMWVVQSLLLLSNRALFLSPHRVLISSSAHTCNCVVHNHSSKLLEIKVNDTNPFSSLYSFHLSLLEVIGSLINLCLHVKFWEIRRLWVLCEV